MKIENIVTNDGSASIDKIKLYDKIPKDFIPPNIKDIIIKVQSGANESLELQDRTEFVDKIELLPDDQDPDEEHEIKVKLHDLAGKLITDTKLLVTYPLLAKNPKPEVKYNTPVKININSKVRGNYFENKPPEEPEIKIKYVKRKLKTLKSIRPGLNEGEFDISIRVRNKGNVELENILVKDKIPSGFSLSEYNPPEGISYEVKNEDDKSVLTVKIPELKGKDSLSIKYTCGGEGDYPRYEPQIVVKGRGEVPAKKAPSDSAPSEQSTQSTSVSQLDASKEAKINDWFGNLFNQLNSTLNAKQLADLIERGRDTLPPGPVLHKLMAFARELRDKGDKMVVGSFLDEVSKKLQGFKSKYL